MESVKSALNNVTGAKQNNISDMISLPPTSSITDNLPANPLEKSNTQKVFDKFSLGTSQNILPKSNMSTWQNWGLRFFLLFVILALLGVNAWAYLIKGTDLFSSKLRTIVSTSGENIFDTIQLTFDNLVKGTRFSGGILANAVKDSINLIKGIFTSVNLKDNESATLKQDKKSEKKSSVSKALKKKENKENATPDVSESSIQKKKTGGFCFIGHQTPHNACIKVDDVRKCLSGKVFKTMSECNDYIPK